MKKKIIIFGATGNTGAYLIDYLYNCLSSEYELIAVGNRETSFFNKYNIAYYKVDITRIDDFNKLPKSNIYAVVMLAGILPAYMQGYNPKKYFEVNTIGGFNVVDYCRQTNVNRIIYTQTISDLAGYFGKEKYLHPYMERKLNYNNDHTVYVISKCAIVDLICNYHEAYGLNAFILRLPNIYMYTENKEYYVNGISRPIAYRLIIDKALKGEPIEVWGDYTKEKDIVYVKDLCQMIYKTIITDKTFGIYNVGTGKGTTLLQQIQGIIDTFCPQDKVSTITFCPNKPDNPEYIMDISNAIDELGYKPQYDYASLLKDFKKEMELDRFSELKKSFIKE